MTTTWQEYLGAVDAIKATRDEKVAARLIEAHGLPREVVPTELLNSKDVWSALTQKMPMTALIRNLATLTRVGILGPMDEATGRLAEQLVDVARLKKARVHPIQVLAALLTYRQGRGARGQHTWTPTTRIIDALDEAFYLSFQAVEPTGKRYLLALDVSGSMGSGEVAQVPGLTPRVASSAMAMVTARTEATHHFVGFTSGAAGEWRNGSGRSMHSGWGYHASLLPLTISPKQRLDDVCEYTARLPMGGTDCALPMVYALDKKIPVDVFVIYTDSETWAGNIHPAAALERYRKEMGIAARLAVVGMVANQFSIADPKDPGMLDVVGFDTAVPNILREFALGNL